MLSAETWLEVLVAHLEAILAKAHARATRSAEEATHPEARSEHAKDTRATEMSYLAHGQAGRTVALEGDLQVLKFLGPRRNPDIVQPPAVVHLTELADAGDVDAGHYLLVPCQGGIQLAHDDQSVLTLTPQAPRGAAMLGKHAGDCFDLNLAGRLRTFEIDEIA